MLAIGIVLLIFATVLLVVGGLAAFRRLPGNPYIGLRLVELRKSKEAWDHAHAVAGPFWALAGISLVFGGLVALVAEGWMWAIPVISVVVTVLVVSVGSNLGARAAYLFDDKPKVDLGALRQAAKTADNG